MCLINFINATLLIHLLQEHYDCVGWQQVSKMTCGYGWVNTCQVDINNSLGVNTVVHAATIEIATKQM